MYGSTRIVVVVASGRCRAIFTGRGNGALAITDSRKPSRRKKVIKITPGVLSSTIVLDNLIFSVGIEGEHGFKYDSALLGVWGVAHPAEGFTRGWTCCTWGGDPDEWWWERFRACQGGKLMVTIILTVSLKTAKRGFPN